MKKRAMDSNDAQVIKILQDNLLTVRTMLGWTAERLGDEVGLTKQTISNLENGASVMTKTQYLAITAVIDMELAIRNDQRLNKKIYAVLEENYDPDRSLKMTMKDAGIIPATGAVIGTMMFPGLVAGLTGLALLSKFSKKADKKKQD